MKNHSFLNIRNLANELVALSILDRSELVEKWRILYGKEPPVGVKNNFLMHGIAHRMQEEVLGGLKPATRRFLEKVAQGSASKQQMLPNNNIKSGTRLLREWHGVTYEVIVMENGVQCNGKNYRSLSEVARAITGARWSGPLFFGLKKQEVV